MTGEEVLGLAQGFMAGQRHVSDMQTAKIARMRDLFALQADKQMQPLRLESQRLQNADAQRLFNINSQMDPWKVREFIDQAKLVRDMMPQFRQRLGLSMERDVAALQQEKNNLAFSNARTPDEMNAALAAAGKNVRVSGDGKGNLWYVDMNGRVVSNPMQDDLFTLNFMDPMKSAAMSAQNVYAIGQMRAEAAMKSAAMFSPIPPTSGFDETAVPAAAPGTERKPINNRLNHGAQGTPSWESGYQNQQTEQQQFAAATTARNAPKQPLTSAPGMYTPMTPIGMEGKFAEIDANVARRKAIEQATIQRKVDEYNDYAPNFYYTE